MLTAQKGARTKDSGAQTRLNEISVAERTVAKELRNTTGYDLSKKWYIANMKDGGDVSAGWQASKSCAGFIFKYFVLFKNRQRIKGIKRSRKNT